MAVTTTVGGTTSGYCAMGSLKSASPPMTRMTIDSTEAKIGRSMKKWANFMKIGSDGRRGASDSWTGREFPGWGDRGRRACRRHLGSGSDGHQAVDHHPLLRFEALANDPQPFGKRTQLHGAVFQSVLIVDHQHKFLSLIRADGLIGDQQGRVLAAAGHAHPGEIS